MKIYNRWLADFVSQAPHRHIGLAQLPMWDLEAAVAEVEWAHEAGLRGVNFPAMREGELPEYNKRVWEPLWSVCEERRHAPRDPRRRYLQRQVFRARIGRADSDREQLRVTTRGLVARSSPACSSDTLA